MGKPGFALIGFPAKLGKRVSACLKKCRFTKVQVRSFTSLRMFHTHAPLPRGHFAQHMHEVSICSYTFPEAGCFNEIKMQGNASELAGMLSTGLASQDGANHRSPTSLPFLSSGRVGKESAMLLPNGWQGGPNLPLRTPGSDWQSSHLREFSSFSRIAALDSLSLMRMLWRTVASWWI